MLNEWSFQATKRTQRTIKLDHKLWNKESHIGLERQEHE